MQGYSAVHNFNCIYNNYLHLIREHLFKFSYTGIITMYMHVYSRLLVISSIELNSLLFFEYYIPCSSILHKPFLAAVFLAFQT